jgi:hypothetical protein
MLCHGANETFTSWTTRVDALEECPRPLLVGKENLTRDVAPIAPLRSVAEAQLRLQRSDRRRCRGSVGRAQLDFWIGIQVEWENCSV